MARSPGIPHRAKLVAAFLTLYVVWGSTYLAIRIGLQADMPPTLFSGIRMASAGLLLFALARLRGTRVRMRPGEYRVVAVVGVLLLCGGMYFTVLAEQYIHSGLSALIVAVVPLWTAGAEWLLPGMDRPTARGLAGLVIGLAGLGLLMYPRLAGEQGSGLEFLGIGLQLFATWTWTAGSMYSKRKPIKTDGTVATGFEMLTAGALLLVLGLALGEAPRMAHVTPTGFAALAYLTVVGSALAFTAFMWLLRNAPASKVMTYAYVNPAVAVLLGWLVLREPLDGWMLAGTAVIVAGVALTTSAPVRRAAHKDDDVPEVSPAEA
ncbi:MAG: EamA family transporter [Coriobacteriia bacterium]|nr:EamA family transporter [Coriobacteriia bacterium]